MGWSETVVLITRMDGSVLKVFRLPTARLDKRTEDEIVELAKKHNQLVEFHSTELDGIESMKWELKKVNRDT